MTSRKLELFSIVIGMGLAATLSSTATAQTNAGPGSHGNGSPTPSQATRCVFGNPADYGFASKQDCLAFFDAGGRMWNFVDDFSLVSNPVVDRWGFQVWSYRRAEYGSPTSGVLLSDRRTLENGTRLQWDTPNSDFNVPLVGVYANFNIGVLHPGRAGVSPLLSVVDWKAVSAGAYEIRIDLWPIDGSPASSPDIGWNVYRDGPGGFQALDGGTMVHVVGEHTTRSLFIPNLGAEDHLYLAIDPGSSPGVADSSNGDSVGFKLTVLRPGQ